MPRVDEPCIKMIIIIIQPNVFERVDEPVIYKVLRVILVQLFRFLGSEAQDYDCYRVVESVRIDRIAHPSSDSLDH